MRIKIQNEKYDTLILIDDWRYAAATVGLVKYLDFLEKKDGQKHYEIIQINDESSYLDETTIESYFGIQGIMYEYGDIEESNFLDFVESYWKKDLPHVRLKIALDRMKEEKENLESKEIEARIKDINELMKANTILKSVLGSIKYDGTNEDEIKVRLTGNRNEIIKSTFKNKKNMYFKFANSNLYGTEQNDHCRLLGYTVDEGRKSKGLGYNFDKNLFEAKDSLELDFIPFAFSKTYDSIFINNNCSVEQLIKTNKAIDQFLEDWEKKKREQFEEKNREGKVQSINIKVALLHLIIEKAEAFMDYDVEIIMKRGAFDYYETLYVRKETIRALKKIASKKNSQKDNLAYRKEIWKDYWIDVEEEVFNAAVNGLWLDGLIERLLKLTIKLSGKNEDIQYLRNVIYTLIRLNAEWKGVDKMEQEEKGYKQFSVSENIEKAKNLAFITCQKLKEKNKANAEQKIKAYRNKLCNALVFHDYDRVKEILLQLSSYADVSYPFIYRLLEDAEANKDIAFAFANGLDPNEKKKENKNENVQEG